MPRPLQSTDPAELPDELKWRYVKIPACMGKGPYMLASAPFGCDTHHPHKRTVPCYKRLKGCTLDCPFCRYKVQYCCWVPLFDFGDKKAYRKVVTGGKKTWADLQGIKPGECVSLWRGDHSRDTLRLRRWTGGVEPLLTKVWTSRVGADISPYLFHLWQRRELTEHFGHRYWTSLNTLANSTGPEEGSAG